VGKSRESSESGEVQWVIPGWVGSYIRTVGAKWETCLSIKVEVRSMHTLSKAAMRSLKYYESPKYAALI
jgi:hypothetical protein